LNLDQYRGCLVGLAVGDAFGGPLEFMSRERIRQSYGRVTEILGGGWLHLRPGEYTDDTQLMLCIARSIVETGRFDASDVAGRFVQWLNTGPKDVGITTRASLEQIQSGESWEVASQLTHERLGGKSAGNGGVMRCAPIALLHSANIPVLVQDSFTSCRITHWHPAAAWSCVALNLGIAGLLQGIGKPDLVAWVQERLDEPADEGAVRPALEKAGGLRAGQIRPSGYAVDTLQAAFWAFLTTDSFEEALVTIVNQGEDTDTAGAVCGALAGAHYGYGAIPPRWLAVLQDAPEIAGLAEEIYRLALELGTASGA
jgi:ADP-ribosyl-[dinitrogen reductase] hydrolase